MIKKLVNGNSILIQYNEFVKQNYDQRPWH